MYARVSNYSNNNIIHSPTTIHMIYLDVVHVLNVII